MWLITPSNDSKILNSSEYDATIWKQNTTVHMFLSLLFLFVASYQRHWRSWLHRCFDGSRARSKKPPRVGSVSTRGDTVVKAPLSSTPTSLHLALGRGHLAVYYNCSFLCLLSRAGESHPETVGREPWKGNLDITHEFILPAFYFFEFLSSCRWNLFGAGRWYVFLWARNTLTFFG